MVFGGTVLFGLYLLGLLPQKSHGHLLELFAVFALAAFQFGAIRAFHWFDDEHKYKNRPFLRTTICALAGLSFARICAYGGEAQFLFVLMSMVLGLVGRNLRTS